MEDLTIKVGGMSCQGCVRNVSEVLGRLPGVEAVQVSLEQGQASLRYDAARITPEDLRLAVEEAGFEAG